MKQSEEHDTKMVWFEMKRELPTCASLRAYWSMSLVLPTRARLGSGGLLGLAVAGHSTGHR